MAAEFLRKIPFELMLDRPKPEAIPPALVTEARKLRERVTATINEARQLGSTRNLPLGWGDAISRSFHASTILEWRSFPEAERQLKDWWVIFAELRAIDDNDALVTLPLKLAESVITSWMRTEPEATSRLIDATEATFQPLGDPRLRSAWVWSLPNYNLGLGSMAKTVPEPGRSALLAKVQSRTEAYANDERIPLERRTRAVARTVNDLYSATKIADASALLERWEQKHPEALQDSFWLTQRYFVAAVGEGNLPKAVQTFRLFEHLIEKGALDPQTDLFKLVSKNYYQILPEPVLLHRSRARTILRQRNQVISDPTTP